MVSKTKNFVRKSLTILIIGILAASFGAWLNYMKTSSKSNPTSTISSSAPVSDAKPVSNSNNANLKLVSGTLIAEPREIEKFNLTKDNNKPFTNQNLKGEWTFLFFGFTSCPDLCPTTMAALNDVYKNLKNDPQLLANTQVVFVSVDPERDTLAHLGDYVRGFNPLFLGATGTSQQLSSMTQQLGVLYTKVAPNTDNSGNYTIDHSGTILLINPKGELQAVFSVPHNGKNIAQDFETIAHAIS